jgi:hypothetical protein
VEKRTGQNNKLCLKYNKHDIKHPNTGRDTMAKAMTFWVNEDLHIRLKMATAFSKETIKTVLGRLVETYVEEVEAEMRPTITVRKPSKKIKL